jgi:hypothetical protein
VIAEEFQDAQPAQGHPHRAVTPAPHHEAIVWRELAPKVRPVARYRVEQSLKVERPQRAGYEAFVP